MSTAIFAGPVYDTPSGRIETSLLTVDDRLRAVAAADNPAVLRAALDVPNLQKTVRVAIERRLRKLATEETTSDSLPAPNQAPGR